MYQRFKLLILFLCAIASATAVFAANAKTASQSSPLISAPQIAPKTMTPSDDAVGGTEAYGKPTTTQPTALGYYMQVQGEVQVGTSAFDYQSNDRQQRQVVMGSDNRIHTVFTYRDINDEDHVRSVYYSGYLAGGGLPPVTATSISPIPGNGGYGSIAVGPDDSLAIATYHYTKQGTGYDTRPRLIISRQAGTFSAFPWYDYPSSAAVMPKILNCQGIKTSGTVVDTVEGGYIWPSIAGDFDGTNTIAHVLAKESPVQDTSGKASLIYYKTPPNATSPPTFCPSLVKSIFIDSTSSNINYDICASPVSNKVAVVYLRPKAWVAYPDKLYGDNDDVFYKQSTNLGDTWGDAIQIADFGSQDSILLDNMVFIQRANEVSALYDDNDCLHVLFQMYWSDPSTHYYITKDCRVYHWSSCLTGCISMLVDGTTWRSASACTMPINAFVVHKINLTQCTVASGPGAGKRLYAVYTMYPDSTAITGNTYSDCSNSVHGALANGDVAVQGSLTLAGDLWGPLVNITTTRTNNCAAGECLSEQFTSAAPYVNDSLRIQYMLDHDAGSSVQNPTGEPTPTPTQGDETNNEIVIKSHPCYVVTPVAILAIAPTEILWPFHTTPGSPGSTNHVHVTLTNTGNTPADYTRTVVYTPSVAPWLTFDNPATGVGASVPAGCVQTQAETVTAAGPAAEGLFKASIIWSYTGGKADTMKVELYNFTNWFMEENNTIRTAQVQMATNQTSRVGSQRAGYPGFRYFAVGDEDSSYLFDGSLLFGKDSLNLSALLHADSSGVRGNGDTLMGRLYGLSPTVFDETSYDPYGYRHSSGIGCNRDSSIAFNVDFYAPKFNDDSANFMIGRFQLYAGPKAPGATIPNVAVCYVADFDIPNTDDGHNVGGFEAALQMVYQQGYTSTNRFAALSAWREDGTAIAGGRVQANRYSVYRLNGFVHDSVWTQIKNTTGYTGYGTGPSDTCRDLNSMLVISKSETIKPKTKAGEFTFYVIFAGQPKVGGSLEGLRQTICYGKAFIKNYLSPSMAPCVSTCTACGDADSSGSIGISDAVFLIAYLYSDGVAPADCNYPNGMGDANGDGRVSVADAAFLIRYIFSGGPAPHCAEGSSEPGQDTGVRDTIAIMCPTIVPSDHLVAGNSFRVEVYLYNDDVITGLSAGFGYNSDLIEITSADFSGSIIPVGAYRNWKSDPANKRFLIGHCGIAGLSTYIPAGTHRGLLCALNVRMLPSIRAGVVDIDTAFVPPSGFFELFPDYGSNSFVPEYADCGVSDIRLGFVCGDANGSGTVNISDAVYLIAYIFSGGPAPSPLLAGDANCIGSVNISDAVYLIAYIFSGGPAPCAGCK